MPVQIAAIVEKQRLECVKLFNFHYVSATLEI